MTAYVMTLGVGAAVVSAYRGVGEVFGFAATQVAPKFVAKMGPASAATAFIWFQVSSLVLSVIGASSWARGWPGLTSSLLLVGGVGVSRFGLWGFDLSVTQLLQENVTPQTALGKVSGTQNAFESSFGATAAAMGMLLASPSEFEYLAIGSWCAVTAA